MNVQTSTPSSGSAAEHDGTRWFAEHVQPNDSALRAYLRHAFPSVRDVDDVVQESYLRIWKARASQPVRSARSFLFQIARRLAIDVLRRRRTTHIDTVPDMATLAIADASRTTHIDTVPDMATLAIADASRDAAEAASLREDLALLTHALHALPPRCRDVMVLRKIEGLSQKEIAARLGIAEGTVQVHVVQGLRKLEKIFSVIETPGERK